MICITLSGTQGDFEKITSLSKEAFEQEGIEADINLSELRLDSFKSDLINNLQIIVNQAVQIAPLITSVATVINATVSVLKFQQDKKSSKQLPSTDNQKLSLTVKTSSGKELELKLSGETTDTDIKDYLVAVGDVIGKSSSRVELSIEEVNSIFKNLLLQTRNIKTMFTITEEIEEGIKCSVEFRPVNILNVLASGDYNFYLPIQDIAECQNSFELLEKGNILFFMRPIPEQIRGLDPDNMMVKYEIKNLDNFDKIKNDPSFIFYRELN
ncbi:hypothetical protein NIES4074_22260 [Cylindrospermum sp. NIES-4074]|nr:hypothetical protein NIES4074_22260 [Cylindrospermum sp. NIES-4074]